MTLQVTLGVILLLILPGLPARGQVPADLVSEPDIEYAVSGGLGAYLDLDVIHPRDDQRLPAVVCIPGGDFLEPGRWPASLFGNDGK